jgi:hypothetical protein
MSFSDMMSSGRGPGVIGMVMALVVLLGFGLLFMYASDETERGGRSIESVIAQQAKDIESYQANIISSQKNLDLAPARTANAKELARLKRSNQALAEKATGLAQAIEAGKAAIALKLQALAAYKDEYRAYARGKAKGEAIAKLETLTGAVYNEVSIREVTAIGIQIRHADGQKRIPFEELPEAMKDHFQFDPKQKAEAVAAEAASRNVHEAAVAVAEDLAGQKMDAQREKDAAAAKAKILQDIAVKEGLIASIQDEIKGLNADLDRAAAAASAARAAGKMHLDKSGSISGNIRSKQGRISTIQAEVVQMRNRL